MAQRKLEDVDTLPSLSPMEQLRKQSNPDKSGAPAAHAESKTAPNSPNRDGQTRRGDIRRPAAAEEATVRLSAFVPESVDLMVRDILQDERRQGNRMHLSDLIISMLKSDSRLKAKLSKS